MKKIILFLAVFTSVIAVKSQETQKVAMLSPVSKSGDVTEMQRAIIRSSLTKALINTEGFEAFSRSDLDAIVNEQKFQQGGMVSDEQRLKLGELSGATLICISTLTSDGQDFFVEVSLIDVKTGKILKTGDQLMPSKPNSEIQKGCRELAYQLVEKTEQKPSPAIETQPVPVVVDSKNDVAITKPVAVEDKSVAVVARETDTVEDEMVKEMARTREEMEKEKASKEGVTEIKTNETANNVADLDNKETVKTISNPTASNSEKKTNTTKFGFKGGSNSADMHNDNGINSSEKGFHIGCLLEIKFGRRFAFQPEVLFSTQNSTYSTKSSYSPVINLSSKHVNYKAPKSVAETTDVYASYVNVPLMFKLFFLKRLNFETGPQVGFLVNQTNTSVTTKNEDSSSVDYGFNYGFGWDITKSFFIGARFYEGIANNVEISNQNHTIANKETTQFYLGFKF